MAAVDARSAVTNTEMKKNNPGHELVKKKYENTTLEQRRKMTEKATQARWKKKQELKPVPDGTISKE